MLCIVIPYHTMSCYVIMFHCTHIDSFVIAVWVRISHDAAIFYSKLLVVKKFSSRALLSVITILFYSILMYFQMSALLAVELFAWKFLYKTLNPISHPCVCLVDESDENETDKDSVFIVWNVILGCNIVARSNSNYLSHLVPLGKFHSATPKNRCDLTSNLLCCR